MGQRTIGPQNPHEGWLINAFIDSFNPHIGNTYVPGNPLPSETTGQQMFTPLPHFLLWHALPAPTEVGRGHVTCFGRWNVGVRVVCHSGAGP